ncbi:MAG: hypothetical protein LBN97_05990, partial [Oscillospiraceae bacterium]|nr:hypothetical protein [Oscillospiraceae bacterium]
TVTALANALEDNFERITTTLKVVILDKTNVRLYPDNDSLKAAAHQNDSGDYDGLYYGRTLMIKTAMPEMDAYDYFSVVAVHEFVHHAQQKVNSKAPAYLREGMAVYLTESEPVLRRATVALTVRNEKFPSMIRLTTMDSGDGAYEFGYAAIDYIVSEYGFDKFLEFYAKPDTKTSLGIESKIFHENLIKYISETYELPDFDNLNDAPFQFTIDSTDFTDAGKTETFTINGKDYTGVYIGVSDISGLGGKNASREFWLLENAYEDVKDIPKRGDMLPYNNFPVQVELGQVFALRYHYTDDTTLIVYMRSSGFIWQNMTSAEEFPSTK